MSDRRSLLIFIGLFTAFLLITEQSKATNYIQQLNLPTSSLVEEKTDQIGLKHTDIEFKHSNIELASLIFFEHTDIE